MKTNWIQRLLNRLGTPAGASVSVDIAALKTALDALGLQYVEGSVSDAGPAAADFDTDLTEATDDHYNGMLLMFTDGDCAGQAHVINDYDGGAKNVSFSAEDIWTDVPGNGDNFIILPSTGTMAKAIYTRVAAIKASTDKLAGAAPGVGSVAANWNSGVATSGEAGADLVTIGANDIRNKLHSLIVDISRGGLIGTGIKIKLFMQVDGVENKVYEETFDATTDPGGVWVVNGTVGIHEALRVELESDVVGDDAKTVHYDYMLEAM